MSNATSIKGVPSTRAPLRWLAATAVEVLLVYAAILLYIWRWQFTHPRVWMILFGVILVTHLARRDTLRALGLTTSSLRASAAVILPIAVAVYIPLVLYGFARQSLVFSALGRRTGVMFATYGLWCVFQQYLMQSYFHHRLMSILHQPHLSSLLVALMFGAAHLPNPILVVATTLGGFIFAEVFGRHRNIWPLALAQAVGGFLVAALSPASLIHNMRVGPAYFFYGIP